MLSLDSAVSQALLEEIFDDCDKQPEVSSSSQEHLDDAI